MITVLIATPLEAALVEQIRAVDPAIAVLYDERLLPPPRFPNDHRGSADFTRSAAAEQQWKAWLGQSDVLFGVPGETPTSLAEVVRAYPNLRWIQGTAAGAGEQVRRAQLSPAELKRVRFTSAVGVHAHQLAEWAIFGLLALTKGLPRLRADQESRAWEHYPVRELRGQTLLVIGLGHIGREVARLASALGMRVIGVRRTPGRADDTDLVVERVCANADLPVLAPAADSVVLSLPATDATAGLLNAGLIEALPSHAVVVNVGRGSTIDEPALIAALRDGRIGGAALDVFATEPLPPESPLWELENVIISPHTAALSSQENARLVDLFCDNLRRYLDRQPLRNLVDTTEFY
ncbi:MAG: D-2-hydroxyacid dehydrogenase [Nocardioidaceae bacterium]